MRLYTLTSRRLIVLLLIKIHGNTPPLLNVIAVVHLAGNSYLFVFNLHLPLPAKILRINIFLAVEERKAAAVEKAAEERKEERAMAETKFTRLTLGRDTEAKVRKIGANHTFQ